MAVWNFISIQKGREKKKLLTKIKSKDVRSGVPSRGIIRDCGKAARETVSSRGELRRRKGSEA